MSPRRPRSLRAVALAAALSFGAFLVLPGVRAGAGGDDAQALLARSRRASAKESFAGLVRVRWRDAAGEQTELVAARSVRGEFVVGPGAERVTGRGELRWAGHEDATGWRAGQGHAAPPPGAAWDLALAGRRTVAGRAATVVTARDDDGRVRARFAIDRRTGQLLQRDVLDRRGRVVRAVGFERIVTTELAPLVPAIPPSGVPVPVPVRALPDGYLAPESVADHYELLGRYRRPDGTVQLYYGDGLFSVSVFEQAGNVEWDALPAGGRDGHVGDRRTRSYSSAEGNVVVWGSHGLVLTGIVDGPPETTSAVVASISGDTSAGGVLRDIADFVLSPFSWG